MKKIALLSVVFLSIQGYIYGQCAREGSLSATDDPSNYPVEGTATIVFNTDGSKQLVFEQDFKTVQGLRLEVFLSTNTRIETGGTDLQITTTPLQDDNGGMDLGDPITGVKAFDIPSVDDINQFNYVIIQCVNADMQWGRATFGGTSGTDCNTILNIEDNKFAAVSLAQNPVKDFINITNPNQQELEIRIFDTVGNLVASQVGKNQENRFDVSGFATGLYVVELTSGLQRKTQQLVIR